MATLNISGEDFPGGTTLPTRSAPHLTHTADEFVYTADVQDVIQDTHPKVYRALLYRSDKPEWKRDVICKIATEREMMTQIRKEADLYEGRLRALQGQFVPEYFGCFEGKNGPCSCLVLAYCGKDLEQCSKSFWTIDWPTKHKLVDALLALHNAGVVHHDFNEHNVLLDQQSTPRIIDFGLSTIHECFQDPALVKFDDPEPWGNEEALCPEIWHVGVRIGVWRLVRFMYYDITVGEDYADKLEELVALAPKTVPRHIALQRAHEAIAKFKRGQEMRDNCERN